MGILYHLTVPPSTMSACDAVVQEVEALRHRFGGELLHLYPSRQPGTRFPRRWWGLQRLLHLRRAEKKTGLHHIYNPDPYLFDVLRFLRRPVVYTVVAGARGSDPDTTRRLARQVHTVVVSTEAELTRLHKWGIQNANVVRPGIDTSRFSHAPLPPDGPPTLLMGSAPWTQEQFRTKGVDVLLELAQQMPELRLIFLWRGILADEMAHRVRSAGLEQRVEVLSEQVDVNDVLARTHATVALSTGKALIKAYPHSLLEALVAGRPVLVGRSIPMSTYVEREGCGVVVEQVDVAGVSSALRTLLRDYASYQRRVLALDVGEWGLEAMVAAYGRIYDATLAECQAG
jgi:glycosyltransferase involved in cell wall biosynthesis